MFDVRTRLIFGCSVWHPLKISANKSTSQLNDKASRHIQKSFFLYFSLTWSQLFHSSKTDIRADLASGVCVKLFPINTGSKRDAQVLPLEIWQLHSCLFNPKLTFWLFAAGPWTHQKFLGPPQQTALECFSPANQRNGSDAWEYRSACQDSLWA